MKYCNNCGVSNLMNWKRKRLAEPAQSIRCTLNKPSDQNWQYIKVKTFPKWQLKQTKAVCERLHPALVFMNLSGNPAFSVRDVKVTTLTLARHFQHSKSLNCTRKLTVAHAKQPAHVFRGDWAPFLVCNEIKTDTDTLGGSREPNIHDPSLDTDIRVCQYLMKDLCQ